MIRWEYKVADNDELTLDKLAILGQLGWELTSVIQKPDNIRRFYFKRPIEDETDK